MILFPLVKYLTNFYTHIHSAFKYTVFKSFVGVSFYKLPYTRRHSRKQCNGLVKVYCLIDWHGWLETPCSWPMCLVVFLVEVPFLNSCSVMVV